MALICIASPKGGVGKTTVASSLAWGIRREGFNVVAIDFDPQNAMRLHLGLPLESTGGYVGHLDAQRDWLSLLVDTPAGVGLLPYGAVTEEERLALNAALRQPGFLAERLAPMLTMPRTVVIVDLPPGMSSALRAVASLADVRVTTLLADAASLALLPEVDKGSFYPPSSKPGSRTCYVLNQVDPRLRLNREITEIVQLRLGDELLGSVHRDEAVAEANATQRSIFQHAPHSLAAEDFGALVQEVLMMLCDMPLLDMPGSTASPARHHH